MTIYWDPDDDTDPDSINVWHIADDGTVTGPVNADISGVTGMPDTIGGIAPDAVRERLIEYLKGASWSDALTKRVVLDMLSLDYERGTPP